jgi:adenylate cyclase
LGELLHRRIAQYLPSVVVDYRKHRTWRERDVVEQRVERKLSAILAVDVAGYSRLMGADEEGTLARLKAHRHDLIEPRIQEYRGRIVKTTGDGILVQFASVVDALRCAVEVQRGMIERNAGVPQERRIEFRMGINVGDIIIDGDDIYGDGVNIAARLEGLADPGGICVSLGVRDEVRDKLDLTFEDAGEHQLKNIARPVRVYRVRLSGTAREAAPFLAFRNKPSIAVLPFENLSGDPEQQYFSDGITEDVITELARFRQLFVIARNSSFQYRGQAVDVKRIGRELGVHYVLEGSVRKVGSRIRIIAQLVETGTGNHLWAERFDRDLQEIFAVQDEVVRTIVGTLVGRVQAASTEQMKRTPPKNMAAYDYVLRGNALPVGSPKGEEEARRMFEKAIEIDPEYGLAHALLVTTLMQAWFRDNRSAEALDEILEIAKKAVILDPDECVCHMVLGWVCLHRRSYDLAEGHSQRGLELNPNKPVVLAHICELLTYLGRPKEAIDWLERARRLDPYHPGWYWRSLGRALFVARRYEEAVAAFNRPATMPPWAHAYIAACHAYLGLMALAKQSAAAVLQQKGDFSVTGFALKEPFKSPADLEHLLDGLRKAGLPE